MKKIILALSMLTALVPGALAAVGPLINGNQINPQTAISIASFTVTGAGATKITGAGGLSVTNSVDASSVTTHGAGFVGAGTGLTGTAASLTAGNVTTNANLTGDVTSVGNATTAAATQANIKILSGLTTISNAFTETSSMTNTSANGLLVTSSVTAGAFFGDASHASGIVTLSANNTFTGANTFSTSIAVSSGNFTGKLNDGSGNDILGTWISWTPTATGSGAMTITGLDTTTYGNSYKVWGKTMCLDFGIAFGTGGTPSTDIIIPIPAGKTPLKTYAPWAAWAQTSAVLGPVRCYANSTNITCDLMPVANWGAANDALGFQVCFPTN